MRDGCDQSLPLSPAVGTPILVGMSNKNGITPRAGIGGANGVGNIRRAKAMTPASLTIDDQRDLRCQLLEAATHLRLVPMLIIDTPHAADDVADAALGVVDWHPGAGHQRARGSPQVVDRPPLRAR